MKLVFAGTPLFAVPALRALHRAGHSIAAVYTQPDRPAGRGRQLQASAVSQAAQALGLPLRKPEKFTAEAAAELRALAPEAMVVVAYGLILPQVVLDIPRHGCFNIHASLLPRWRGAAPIQRAILEGDRETGITIMRMDAGLDTGPILLQEKLDIPEHASAGDLQESLSRLGAELMLEALKRLTEGRLQESPQPLEGATYAKKLSKEEARLDWSLPAEELARRVRGYNPAPVAWTELGDERIRIYRAHAVPHAVTAAPGSVLNAGHGIDVATGIGVLRIEELQRSGGRPLPAIALARGCDLVGKRFR